MYLNFFKKVAYVSSSVSILIAGIWQGYNLVLLYLPS